VLGNEPEGVSDGNKNVFPFLDDDLDSCVIEEHLQKQQKKKENHIEKEAQIKGRQLGE